VLDDVGVAFLGHNLILYAVGPPERPQCSGGQSERASVPTFYMPAGRRIRTPGREVFVVRDVGAVSI
jgi:hypothetical protein